MNSSASFSVDEEEEVHAVAFTLFNLTFFQMLLDFYGNLFIMYMYIYKGNKNSAHDYIRISGFSLFKILIHA